MATIRHSPRRADAGRRPATALLPAFATVEISDMPNEARADECWVEFRKTTARLLGPRGRADNGPRGLPVVPRLPASWEGVPAHPGTGRCARQTGHRFAARSNPFSGNPSGATHSGGPHLPARSGPDNPW